MRKEFFPYIKVRNNAIKLAYRIYTDGFIPDVIYVSLRGGAYLGNVISEFFKAVRPGSRPVFYAALVARSYTGIGKKHEVMVDGWTYNPEHLRHGDKVLLIDDIFDSGRTINYLVKVVLGKGIPEEDIKVAVHDYKIKAYEDTALPVAPDYYCRKFVIDTPEKDFWIHYLSHELIGLSKQEQEEHYISMDAELAPAFELLNQKQTPSCDL